jgi:ubiquinone/menaquinone biosynthesis C-methylase UbiE
MRAKRGEIMSYKPVPALGKDWLTPFYDVLLATVGWGPQLTEKMLERAHIQDGERVLDVGCATATLLIAAKARYPAAQLVGVDPDERALQIARKKIARQRVEVEVVRARAENLPFEPSSFDVVMSSLVFHHLPTEIKQQAMHDIYRVLTPGGRLLLADFGKPEGVLLSTLFALSRFMWAAEARYVQDNKEGKLPLFLEEVGFAVQELPPRYRGVQFLLAAKDAGAQEGGKA